jgi:putative sigma-54 modulation protein
MKVKHALVLVASAAVLSASLVSVASFSINVVPPAFSKNGQTTGITSTTTNSVMMIQQSLLKKAIIVSSQSSSRQQPVMLFMASPDDEEGEGGMSSGVPIVVSGTNIDVTEALKAHVRKKMEKVVGKLASSGLIRECNVHLTVTKNPEVTNSHAAEVTTYLKGTTIRSTMATPDMYGSIDLVSSKLARKLAKYKDRRIKGFHGGANMGQQLADILEEISLAVEEDEDDDNMETEDYDDYSDNNDEQSFMWASATDVPPGITRIKSFDLSKPQSLKEAIFALDYIDHDFYVFRDAATDLISVVYKRDAGGIGLIQPQQ